MPLLYVRHLVCQDFVQFVFLHRRRIQENPPKEREGSGRAIQAFHTDAVYRLLRRTQDQMPQTARLHEESDGQHQHSGEVQVFHPIGQHPHAVSRFRRFTSHHNFRQHYRIVEMRQHNQAVTTFQPFPHVDQRQHERQHQCQQQNESSGTEKGVPRTYQLVQGVKQDQSEIDLKKI